MERYIDQPPPPGSSSKLAAKFNQRLQVLLDKSAPWVAVRWVVWLALSTLFALRVWWLKGFYIVAYALGIFNLNLLLGFLSPQVRRSRTLLPFEAASHMHACCVPVACNRVHAQA